ncbi:helix-turn-helix domain-containing protein [Sphingobacterium deserti]|uniref:Helix-turn-helix domain protein n=1 Tax=Sphingobacterium deserti TaxID=1229276 RepID=A0A0B8T474_9SPHI|nr:helix-turn-helix transcriptional regulator [Sphingobacterium deserti]KGE14183.1 helix-turn-helix domain protein [Sphingobacterium deserti]
MVLFISPSKAQLKIAEQIRAKRLAMNLTQEGLAERSGVALPTLRKFEQKGLISLESFVKLLMVVGGVEAIIEALQPSKAVFASIDDVLKDENTTYHTRKRARKK